MKWRIVYAERAQRDIGAIYDRIARHDTAAAQRVEDLIRANCERLQDFPMASASTDEPNVRRMPLVRHPYTIFYRVDRIEQIVEIARVVHGARVRNLGIVPD